MNTLKELIIEVERLKWKESEGVSIGSNKATAHNCLWGIKQTVEAVTGSISEGLAFYSKDYQDWQKLKKLLGVK